VAYISVVEKRGLEYQQRIGESGWWPIEFGSTPHHLILSSDAVDRTVA